MASGADRAGGRRSALRLLLRPLYGVLVRLSAVLHLPLSDGLSLWHGLSLPLSARTGARPGSRSAAGLRTGPGAKPGAGLCTGATPATQCSGPADTTAAALIIRQIQAECRAASKHKAAMILSASASAPGSWVRM